MVARGVVQVPVNQLKLGMYVSQLDRPWLETPFLLQGFMIHSVEDIDELRKHCTYVYVDIVKGKAPSNCNPSQIMVSAKETKAIPPAKPVTKKSQPSTAARKDGIFGVTRTPETQQALEEMFPHRTLKVYEDKAPVKEELQQAKKVYKDFSVSVVDLVEQAKSSNTFDVERVKSAVDPMVESIMRNPDACMWLARLKNKDSYTYKHSMGASVWAVALGRQIGLPKVDLKNLAIGTMLCDVGKLKLPAGLLNKESRLSKGEFTMVKSHVELGLESLRQSSGLNNQILDIVAYHHERFNGTGYPKKLKGVKIPVLARIAAIADCYDAMTSERPYASAISPSLAVRKLYEWRDEDFQSELIEEFIQAVGLYPAGTLVELSNGAVGIVVSESRTRRLRPTILLLLDRDKNPLEDIEELNLMRAEADDTTGEPLYIMTSLSPGSYDIDPESIYF
ncbi:MAG: HD-GYP domain-containing protein [Pseudomonadales bacterium]|nr:HD-GYP domain-containing protein [Pseudomonadales bacterium]